jgi:hypothetical protein
MAKFVTDDGKGGISGDRLLDQLRGETPSYSYDYFPHAKKKHTDVDKLKVPSGRLNSHRLNNINMYELLTHIQQTLSLNNRCIIEMITNEDHRCINTNETIQRRIHLFAEKFINDDFKQANPKQKVRFKVDEDNFDYRDETDEEWLDRLCHIYMHRYHPSKLQMIKCEECLQCWMNSDKW